MSQDKRRDGIDALKAGKFADAVETLSAFVGSNSDDAEARLAFALALTGVGKHQQAIIHIDKLLKVVPDSVKLRWSRAQVLERLNRPNEAMKEYRQVLALEPAHPKAKARLEKLQPAATVGSGNNQDAGPAFELVEDSNEIDDSKMRVAERLRIKSGDLCGDLKVIDVSDDQLILATDSKSAMIAAAIGALFVFGGVLIGILAVDWKTVFGGRIEVASILTVVLVLAGIAMLSQLYWMGFQVVVDATQKVVQSSQFFGLIRKSIAFNQVRTVQIQLVKPKYYDEQACKVFLLSNAGIKVPLGQGQVQFAHTEILLRLANDVAGLLDMQFSIQGHLYEPHPTVRATYDFVTGDGPPPDLAAVTREARQQFFAVPTWAWAMAAIAVVVFIGDLLWMTVPIAVGVFILQLICIGSIIYSLRVLSKPRRKDEFYVTLQHSPTANRIYIGASVLAFLICPLIGFIKPDAEPENADRRRRGPAAVPQLAPAAPTDKGKFRPLTKDEQQKAVDSRVEECLAGLRGGDKSRAHFHLASLQGIMPNARRAEVVQLVLPHLTSENMMTKRAAIHVLKNWGDESCLQAIRNCESDSDQSVRKAAQAAIAEIEKRRPAGNQP